MKVQLLQAFEYMGVDREVGEVLDVTKKVGARWIAAKPPFAEIPDEVVDEPLAGAGEAESAGRLEYDDDAEESPQADGDDPQAWP